MVTDSKGTIVYMNKDEAETFDVILPTDEIFADPKEIDSDLGLELVPEKPSIFAKYGVNCDPSKNSFHKSLYDQYQARGSLSDKQVNALRKSF